MENGAPEEEKIRCPKCGSDRNPADRECLSCGVIFEKIKSKSAMLSEQVLENEGERGHRIFEDSSPFIEKKGGIGVSYLKIKDAVKKHPQLFKYGTVILFSLLVILMVSHTASFVDETEKCSLKKGVDLNNNTASYNVVLSTLYSKEQAAYRLCSEVYDIANDCEKITSIKLSVYMDKDQVHNDRGNAPSSNPYMGTINIDNVNRYRLYDSNPFHKNIAIGGFFVNEVSNFKYSYLLRN